ncbi:hypothetical protein [Vibrio breoganii]|uniref:hypothetical protein n=1 Tax=Vibrio breoganii TaxID=553239 RepID=UPI001055B896|nr:hypothetical protein [Vibrio breoganii]
MSTIRWVIPKQLKEISEQQAKATKKAILSELESIDEVIDDVDKKLGRARQVNNHRDISSLEEMKRVGYGKSILINSEKKGLEEYRVTQAAGAYANTKHGVATALSPIGSLCRQSYVGFEGKSKILGNFEVLEIRTFERFKGHESADNVKNFQLMVRSDFVDSRSDDINEFYTEDLKRTAKVFNESDSAVEKPRMVESELPKELDPVPIVTEDEIPSVEQAPEPPAMMFEDDVDYDDEPIEDVDDELEPTVQDIKDEYFGLSNSFYLNPTREQYEIMSNKLDTGPMLVEGIAGSGKTCAALGRAKTLVDLSQVVAGESDEYEATDFFDQQSSVGIVRTGELVQYLKQTCNELNLSHLPVIEYDELRARLQNSRELEQRTKTDNTPKYTLSLDVSNNDYAETTMAWLKQTDQAIFEIITSKVNRVIEELEFDASKFEVAKPISGSQLIALTRDLKSKLAANFNQWVGSRHKQVFLCDSAVSQIHALIQSTLANTVEKNGIWYSLGSGEPQFTTTLSNVFLAYRNHGCLFVDRNEPGVFQLATEEDLKSFIALGITSLKIPDTEQELPLDTSFDSLWDVLSELGDKQYIEGTTSEGTPYKSKLVDSGQLTFLRTEKRLYVYSDPKLAVRPFERPNPYQARITSLSKASAGKAQMFSAYLKSRLVPRLFNYWHIADIYREALLLSDTKWESDHTEAFERLKARKLNTHDVDVLLAMSHIMSTKDKEPLATVPVRWLSTNYYRSVFVDEVQDFTEIQVFIMGQQASPEYDAVTMVGDMRQQLKSGRAKDLDACFPYRKLSKHLLIENKRQEFNATLGAVSQLFRRYVQGDERLCRTEEEIDQHLEALKKSEGYSYSDLASVDTHDKILDIINTQPNTRTVAVLTPSLEISQELEANLRDRLHQGFRQSYVSDKVQLNKKFQIHFSSPEHIKGLEFDTVIVVGLEHCDWAKEDQVNGIYVTLSRPRKELHILAKSNELPSKVSALLSSTVTTEDILYTSNASTDVDAVSSEFESWLPLHVMQLKHVLKLDERGVAQYLKDQHNITCVQRSVLAHEDYLDELSRRSELLNVERIDEVINLCSSLNLYVQETTEANHTSFEPQVLEVLAALETLKVDL